MYRVILLPCSLPLLAPAIAELASNQIATHELTVGGNFTLSVNVTSFNIPLISISWAHGGKPLTGDEDRVNIQTSAVLPVSSGSVTSTLQIGVAVLADAGNYIATVKSSTGSSTVQFEVIILTGIGACGVVSRKRVGGGGGREGEGQNLGAHLWKSSINCLIQVFRIHINFLEEKNHVLDPPRPVVA